MAVRERKTTGGGFDVATFFNKKQYWEPAGNNKRDAQRLDAQRKREVKEGTYVPPALRKQAAGLDPTIEEYSVKWGNSRTNVSAVDDRRNIKRFMSVPGFGGMRMSEPPKPRHVIAALDWLKQNGGVKIKTLQNAYGSLTTMFRDAVIAELLPATPCVLPKGYFDSNDEEDEAEEREPYTRTEAALLVAHNVIPEPIRVLNAMCVLGGYREGEACGRRWKDLDLDTRPLARMLVNKQYEGRRLKTKRPRVVPVHPELLEILMAWAEGGFVKLMGRPPTPEDFIVPRRSNYSKKGHWTRSTYYKAFVKYAELAGVPPRTLHATRHTMITLARRGGARKDHLSLVTHNAKGDIVDGYTHVDWEPLCAAVLCIGSLFAPPQSPPLLGGSGGIPAGRDLIESTRKTTETRLGAKPTRLQFPAPPRTKQHDLSHFAKPVQTPVQSGSAIAEDPRRPDEGAWDEAVGEQLGAVGSRVARPPAKTAPYVARKRTARGGPRG